MEFETRENANSWGAGLTNLAMWTGPVPVRSGKSRPILVTQQVSLVFWRESQGAIGKHVIEKESSGPALGCNGKKIFLPSNFKKHKCYRFLSGSRCLLKGPTTGKWPSLPVPPGDCNLFCHVTATAVDLSVADNDLYLWNCKFSVYTTLNKCRRTVNNSRKIWDFSLPSHGIKPDPAPGVVAPWL